jgi:hypothetical protein
MQAVRRQGEDARECSGADGDQQQQTDAKSTCGFALITGKNGRVGLIALDESNSTPSLTAAASP